MIFRKFFNCHINLLYPFFQKLNRLLLLLIPASLLSHCAAPYTYTYTYTFQRPRLDPQLQSEVENIVADLGLSQAVHEKHLNFAMADITDIKHPIMAGMNETSMMYAASLPKIAILFAIFKRLENGELVWNDEIRLKAEDMIRNSSNTAATDLYYMAGPLYIIELLTSEKYKLYDKRKFAGLWIGKEYGKAPAVSPDPISGLVHGATPFAVLRFYYLLESGQLLSKEWAERMKDVMSQSAFNSKFLRGLRTCCPDAMVYRKAGAWRDFSSDSVLVVDKDKRYIIAGFTNDPNGEEWLEKLAPRLNAIAGKERYTEPEPKKELPASTDEI